MANSYSISIWLSFLPKHSLEMQPLGGLVYVEITCGCTNEESWLNGG